MAIVNNLKNRMKQYTMEELTKNKVDCHQFVMMHTNIILHYNEKTLVSLSSDTVYRKSGRLKVVGNPLDHARHLAVEDLKELHLKRNIA